MTYFNEFGQARLGWNVGTPSGGGITPSTLWSSIYSVYNADSVGSSSLKTSLFAAYNGESNANDSFGSNNGTDIGGLTYTTGKIGNAFQFNGTTSYVSLPNSANQFNFTGDFSVSCWFKTNTVSGNQMIFSNLAYNGGNRRGYYIVLAGNTIGCWLTNHPQYQEFYTSGVISTGTWYHLSVTRESGVVKIYLNGTLLATDTNAITLGNYVTVLTSIGAYTNGVSTTSHFNGQIDALNIWQKSLTQSEITELYNSGNGAQYIGDNFYKPTTNDALGINNGTAQGGLTYGVGKIGTSFVGNGTNGYVSFPNNSWNFTGTLSINLWVYLSTSNVNSVLISNYYYSSGGRDYGYLIEHMSNGNLRFYMQTSSNSPVILSTPYSGKYNSWKMITITKLQNSSLKMYIDGVNVGTNNNTPDIFYNSINYSTICASSYLGVTYGYLENGGKIDAVGIWQKELTQSEITELYNSGNGKQYPN
jgi:hypothetical protein